MLIRRAELDDGSIAAVRISGGNIVAIGMFEAGDDERVLDAQGGRLLPGLHDHHIHVAALAASLDSVFAGPPEVTDAQGLAERLRAPGSGWLRAIGYHESVAGMLDAAALDRIAGDRPVRMQHRSGRMWFFNSAGLETILQGHDPPPGLEQAGGRYTGRLFDEDVWLRGVLGSKPPSFARAGTMLARTGVTGLTEMSPANDGAIARHFAAEAEKGSLPQRVLLAGSLRLTEADMGGSMRLGAAKLHLHEADLPSFEEALDFVGGARMQRRSVAIHCVTEVELVFALALLAEAGAEEGDRIEHASIAPDTAVAEIVRLGLAVVSQPHFVAERGDAYRSDVDAGLQPFLYRLRTFLKSGVPLAAGSDAPFGGADPWSAMAAAVSRRTAAGRPLGTSEALTPEDALDLYLRDPLSLRKRRRIEVGAPADLCLLDRPWAEVRGSLSSERVRATFIAGRPVFDRIDQAPA